MKNHISSPAAYWQPLGGNLAYGGSNTAMKRRRTPAQCWAFMTVLWAIYYFAVFSLARYPEYQQKIIWSGGVCLVAASLFLLLERKTRVPPEVLLLFGLACWSLGGLVEVRDLRFFSSYLKLIIEMAAVVWCVSVALRHSGGIHWFCWAFVAAGVFNVLVAHGNLKIEPAELVHGQNLRSAGITENPNSLGFYCFLGIFGAMTLFGKNRSWWLRGGLTAAAGICLYGLVASASRGSFMLTLVAMLLWPVFCFREKLRNRWRLLFVTLAVSCVVVFGGLWVMHNTFMGYRVEQGLQGEDTSSKARMKLAWIGLRLCLERPIFGYGLGQFPAVSGTGAYAHNEWSELLATTGVVGFILYMGVYAVAWRRLTRAIELTQDNRLRYEINTARLIVVLLVVSGVSFRPNFLYVDTMFLIGMAVGVGQWASSRVRREAVRKACFRNLLLNQNTKLFDGSFPGKLAATMRRESNRRQILERR